MTDIMLDLETFGNGKDKVICQIGAVYFDKVTGELGKELKINVDAASHVQIGGKIDAQTVYWWLAQSDEARKSILEGPKIDILPAMLSLNAFIKDAKRVWSHATFDFVTIMDTFKQLNLSPSFSYKIGLDLRTLVYLAGTRTDSFYRVGVHHDALEDCKHQVKYCVAALNKVKSNKKLLGLLENL